MKHLIYKELGLGVHPVIYMFLLFAAMLLIPQYPYYVAFFYLTLGIFFTFNIGRENRDIYYTALLPVAKRDVVKARVLAIAALELLQLLLAVPVGILSAKINPLGGNGAGIDINPALFGLGFVMFGGFNLLFVTTFYRTAHNLTRPCLYGWGFVLVFVLVAESLAQYIPGPVSDYLDASDPAGMLRQWPVLLGGLLVWLGATVLTYRISAKRFERVDL